MLDSVLKPKLTVLFLSALDFFFNIMVIIYMCIQLAREAVGREIQQKKEELYDVIAKAEQSFGTSNFQNLRLLQHLSVQVNPRPWDWEWYDDTRNLSISSSSAASSFSFLRVADDVVWPDALTCRRHLRFSRRVNSVL
jgi:hypothetical protein